MAISIKDALLATRSVATILSGSDHLQQTAPMSPVTLFNNTAVWANSASANTEVVKDLDGMPTGLVPDRLLVIIRNPSTVSALTCQVRTEYADPNGGTTRWADISGPAGTSTFTALANNLDGQAFLVDGGIGPSGGRLSLKNATVLSGAQGFTASVQVLGLCGT